MDGALTLASADTVRACIAALLAPKGTESLQIGSIALEPHQRTAVARVTAAIREFGGALLADETGLGKTFVALAVARGAERPLVVAPAALREMWYDSARCADVPIAFVSAEALSRERPGRIDDPDLVIVDECHHFRNPATARYRALAELTANAQMLLLSATPVHNSTRDLGTILSLFLGARASTLDPAWTGRCIVRRSPRDVPTARLPDVPPSIPLCIEHDERHLDALLSLPPPVPPVDGGDGGSLLVYSLLRQWASTRAALVEALRRRLARATALIASLDAGRHPSESELAAWSFADGAIQLAFPEMVVNAAHYRPDASDLAVCVRAHADAARALLNDLASSPDQDEQRATHLLALRGRYPDARIVVFSQYADSIAGMFRLLRDHRGVAALTADGGRVAGGVPSRGEVLARFAPRAQNVAPPRPAESVQMLLTTDLLSEGVNLQDASVVVHLDMPWTPARFDQRVGRVARLGSRHDRVAVYVMLPPAGAERIVRVEQRLREKLGVATRTVGVAGTIIPSLSLAALATASSDCPDARSAAPRSPAELSEAIQTVLSRWRQIAAGAARGSSSQTCGAERFHHVAVPAGDSADGRTVQPAELRAPNTALFAAVETSLEAPAGTPVEAPPAGFIAVLGDPAHPRLIADVGAGPTDDPATLLAALRAADGDEVAPPDAALGLAMNAIARWRSENRHHRELSVEGALRARARRSVADRISAITRRAPRHLRPTIAALAATARRTVTGRFGAGAERVLGELAGASMPDEAWLRAVSTFGSIHEVAGETGGMGSEVLALLLLIPRRDSRHRVTPAGAPAGRDREPETGAARIIPETPIAYHS